jgi:hypothetical protein
MHNARRCNKEQERSEFYVMDIMMNRKWIESNYDLRHVVTHLAEHGCTIKSPQIMSNKELIKQKVPL